MKSKTVWKLGIRHKKDWSHWDWSPEFPTLDACFAAYSKWLAANPNRVVQFGAFQVYVNEGVQ